MFQRFTNKIATASHCCSTKHAQRGQATLPAVRAFRQAAFALFLLSREYKYYVLLGSAVFNDHPAIRTIIILTIPYFKNRSKSSSEYYQHTGNSQCMRNVCIFSHFPRKHGLKRQVMIYVTGTAQQSSSVSNMLSVFTSLPISSSR